MNLYCQQCGNEIQTNFEKGHLMALIDSRCTCGYYAQRGEPHYKNQDEERALCLSRLNRFLEVEVTRPEPQRTFGMADLQMIMQTDDSELAVDIIADFVAQKRFENPDKRLAFLRLNR